MPEITTKHENNISQNNSYFPGVLFKKTSEIHQKGNNQLGKIQSHKIRNHYKIRNQNQIITSQLMKNGK